MFTLTNAHKGMAALGAVLVTTAMVAGVATLASQSEFDAQRQLLATKSTDRIEVIATRLVPAATKLVQVASR
jgi:hypothetical protein